MMDENTSLIKQLESHIQTGENQEIEFMEVFPSNAQDLAKEIAAFASSNAGIIYLGVKNNKEIVGITRNRNSDSRQKDEIQNRIAGICQKSIKPSIIVKVDFIDMGGSLVVKITTPKGNEPVYFTSNIPYIRNLTTSEPATPEQVKELHRLYFLSQTPSYHIVEHQPKVFFDVLMQLSDFEMMWSDKEERSVNPDLEQLRYDIHTTGGMLRQTSLDKEIKKQGMSDELENIAESMIDLSEKEFYIDGGKSWKEFLGEGDKILSSVQKLKSRINKRISLNSEEYKSLLEELDKNIHELDYIWNKREKYLNRGDLSALKEQLRMLAYNFYRIANAPNLLSKLGVKVELDKIAIELRSLSSIKYFMPSLGYNPLEAIKDSMNKILTQLKTIPTISKSEE